MSWSKLLANIYLPSAHLQYLVVVTTEAGVVHGDVVSGEGVGHAVRQVAPGDGAGLHQDLVGSHHAGLQAEPGKTELGRDDLFLIGDAEDAGGEEVEHLGLEAGLQLTSPDL